MNAIAAFGFIFLFHQGHNTIINAVDIGYTIETVHQGIGIDFAIITHITSLYAVGMFLHLNAFTDNSVKVFCQSKMYAFVYTLALMLRT